MATYNGAQYIKEQLQSFVEQTRRPDELIITDDGSSDDTETIVRNFAKTAPFEVEFHRNEKNLGYCGNFNAALMKTTGDLVFLSDQDDVWFPKKIEHILSVAERYPEALLLMNDAMLTNSELEEVELTKIGQIRSAGMPLDKFVMGCCCAVRRELLELCLPIPAGFKAHDNWLVWFANGMGAKLVDDIVLQYYRRHETNQSQFIANRTTKVTRTRVFLHSVESLFRKDASQQSKDGIAQLKIFADGVQAVMDNSPGRYHQKLAELQAQTIQKISTEKARAEIRQKWFIPRVAASLRYFLRGGYRNTSGLTAVLRDIVG
ncbi:family 2 glycosyl transferase [Marinobacter vulgaris]|uniref:Family 2 glycosyl transferase n=2 Tax=Marinobacter vulgaris TaxID=1928331 RepID=A0A2V3ZJ37_9GAMM|nr:family 2 glycosyl transferase [Marinobacter vulgaris]TSJ66703.1 glycosyltransferase family 2 protein [Marinobacter vulgaris]